MCALMKAGAKVSIIYDLRLMIDEFFSFGGHFYSRRNAFDTLFARIL